MNPHADQDESPIEAKLSASPSAAGDVPVPPSPAATPPFQQRRLLQSRGAVLATLFLVTGALGIPLLWMNKAFSNVERYFWALIVSLYTALLIYAAWQICRWSYHQIVG
ncbi:hypothetical protein Pla52o_20790 [Novipirellula galeiformis]|uniref:Uncharacterized protein n=1 Tax=Novipirellula galeiformis TaxID=2528004 RepID=A0A5C6CJ41_9BACT|nr:hypothetical protein [Novipirellula galeiformis]TWU24155.1 hypothetical protein Pla52o_20790 [Novipirellula galeiformis]